MLLAQLLGVSGLGLLAIVMRVVQVTNHLFSFRMNEFVVKFVAEPLAEDRPRQASAALKVGLLAEGASSLVAGALAMAAAPWAARQFVAGDPAAVEWIRIYAVVLLMNAVVESTTGALQVFDRFSVQASSNVIRKVVAVTGVAAVWLWSGSLLQVLVAYLLAQLAANGYQLTKAFAAARAALGDGWWRVSMSVLRPRRRELTKFALSTNIGATLSMIVRESDLLWIAYFRSPLEAGYYELATRLLKLPFAAGSPMSNAVYPELVRTTSSASPPEIRALLARITRLAALWVVPVVTVVALATPWIITTFYGTEFSPAAPAVYILLVGSSAAHLLFWSRPTLLALGRPDAALAITVGNSLLKVAAALLLVPAGGYLALAGILSGLNLLGATLSVSFILWSLHRQEQAPLGRLA